jgi:hypothetical protein
MENNKMTALDWMVEQLRMQTSLYTKEEIISIARGMGKQEIIDAFFSGDKFEGRAELADGEQYYNETFKKVNK